MSVRRAVEALRVRRVRLKMVANCPAGLCERRSGTSAASLACAVKDVPARSCSCRTRATNAVRAHRQTDAIPYRAVSLDQQEFGRPDHRRVYPEPPHAEVTQLQIARALDRPSMVGKATV